MCDIECCQWRDLKTWMNVNCHTDTYPVPVNYYWEHIESELFISKAEMFSLFAQTISIRLHLYWRLLFIWKWIATAVQSSLRQFSPQIIRCIIQVNYNILFPSKQQKIASNRTKIYKQCKDESFVDPPLVSNEAIFLDEIFSVQTLICLSGRKPGQ